MVTLSNLNIIFFQMQTILFTILEISGFERRFLWNSLYTYRKITQEDGESI